jgi:hypothetical protein
MAFFVYKFSVEVILKFRQNPDLSRKVRSVQIFPNSATRPSFDGRNSKAADHLELDNEPSESGESYLTGWYSEVQEFQICPIFGILFRPNCCTVQFSF